MNSHDYIVQPVSRRLLWDYAMQIRRKLNLENVCYFPVVEFLESMWTLFPKFHYEILWDDELPKDVHADMDIVNHCMRIKQSVYDGACKGNGRDRFTITHEQGHYLTLGVSGFRLQRNFEKRKLRPFEQPEWQANNFAAGLLMPVHLIRDMSPQEMVEACGVSWTAANVQCEQIRRGR